MSKPKVFNWPLIDAEAICVEQTNALGGGPLIINGTLSIPSGNNSGSKYVKFPGFSRVVRITSVDEDNSAVDFTVNGLLDGVSVSQTLAGADGSISPAFVETTQDYDTITSITTDVRAVDVQVGTGSTGFTAWNLFDYNQPISTSAAQVVVEGTITYSFATTLDDVAIVDSPFLVYPDSNLHNQTTSKAVSFGVNPWRYSTVVISSSDETGSLVATILQTGI